MNPAASIESARMLRAKDKRIRELEGVMREYEAERDLLTARNRELQAELDETRPKVRPISLAIARAVMHDDPGPSAA